MGAKRERVAMAQSGVERGFVRRLGRLRADGRSCEEPRVVSVSLGRNSSTGRAHCEVGVGATRALAVVSARAVAPFPDRPSEGLLKVTTVLSSMGNEDWDPTQRSSAKETVRVSSILENAILESRALDLEGLCIVAGRKVWAIDVSVSIINDAGSVVDCGCLAAFGALCHFRRPDVSIVGDTVKIYPLDEREPVPLSIHHTPLCVTFALIDRHKDLDLGAAAQRPPSAPDAAKDSAGGDGQEEDDEESFFLLDPSDREELAEDGRVTVIVNEHREICGIHKHGWPALSSSQLARLVALASARAEVLCKQIAPPTV